jgi:hypothetical protein
LNLNWTKGYSKPIKHIHGQLSAAAVPLGIARALYQIQLLDGFASTRGHVTGELTSLFREAGFQAVQDTGYLRTMFGTLRFLRGVKRTT